MKKLALAALFGLATVGGAQAATVIFSDDFEGYSLGTPSDISAKWDVSTGSVDVIGTGSIYEWWGTGQYLDLNGSPDSPAKISTTLSNLTNGATYLVSFAYGYNLNSGANEILSFGVDSSTFQLGSPIVATAPTLSTYSFSFVANGTSAVLFFADGGGSLGDAGGPILDNVSVSAVPVPAAGLGLMSGLGLLAMIRRRKAVRA